MDNETTTMTIRKATLEDIPLIHDMAWKTFPETYKDIITPEQRDFMMEWMYSADNLNKQMTEEGHVYLIADDAAGEALGYVSVQPQKPGLWHLQKIYVLPEHQKEHIGKLLFNAAVAYIRDHVTGPCTMELNVNRYNRALGFYKHMGMHIARKEDNDIGNGFFMNDYVMAIEVSE